MWGYLKTYEYKEAWANLWKKATPEDVKALKALPNFDAKIFEEITGINIEKDDNAEKKEAILKKIAELKAEADKL